MSEKNQSLARWVEPVVPEQRLHRMWAEIESADRRRGFSLWVAVPLAASVLLAAGLIVSLVTRPHAVEVGDQVASADTQRVTRFADGSTAELGPNSTLTLAAQSEGQVEVQLQSGSATFEVSKRPSRKFVVKAADVTVRVVGTRFTVTEAGEQVDVEVTRGIVEVVRHGETVRLTAGQSWHSTQVASADPEVPHAAVIDDGDELDEADDEPAATPSVLRPAKRTKKSPKVRRAQQQAQTAMNGLGGSGALPAKSAELDLFQSALQARREGRSTDAAAGFERFIHQSVSDERAPVAAFELGRIRMDALGDARGAVEALRLSLRLDGRAAFREEAQMRLVRALDELGQTAECQRARDAYLSSYPGGAYAQSVKSRCAGARP